MKILIFLLLTTITLAQQNTVRMSVMTDSLNTRETTMKGIVSDTADVLRGAISDSLKRYVYFVDSENGSDSNDGKTVLTPFQSLAQLMSVSPPAYSTIYLATDSYWRDILYLGNNYKVESYGGGEKPIISAADTMTKASFVQYSGSCYRYATTITTATGSNNHPNNIVVWENGEYLKRRSTLADVISMPGSFIIRDSTTGEIVTQTNKIEFAERNDIFLIYIHPSGGGDITTNGRVYEFTKRGSGIELGDNGVVKGIHTTKSGHDYGSLILGDNGYIDDCIASYGHKHNLFIESGTVKNTTTYRNEVALVGSATQFVSYSSDATGKQTLFENCIAYPDSMSWGFLSHSPSPYDRIIYKNCKSIGTDVLGETSIGFDASEVYEIYVIDCVVENSIEPFGGGFGHPTLTNNLTILNTSVFSKLGDMQIIPNADSLYVIGSKFVTKNSSSTGLWRVNHNGAITEYTEFTDNVFIFPEDTILSDPIGTNMDFSNGLTGWLNNHNGTTRIVEESGGKLHLHSTDASFTYATQNILTVGSQYQITYSLDSISGRGHMVIGDGTSDITLLAGTNTFVATNSGTTGYFYVRNENICEFTIDNIIIREFYNEKKFNPILVLQNPKVILKRNVFFNLGEINLNSVTADSVVSDSNLFYPVSANFLINSHTYSTIQNYIDTSGNDANSSLSDPLILNNPYSVETNYGFTTPIIALRVGNYYPFLKSLWKKNIIVGDYKL